MLMKAHHRGGLGSLLGFFLLLRMCLDVGKDRETIFYFLPWEPSEAVSTGLGLR